MPLVCEGICILLLSCLLQIRWNRPCMGTVRRRPGRSRRSARGEKLEGMGNWGPSDFQQVRVMRQDMIPRDQKNAPFGRWKEMWPRLCPGVAIINNPAPDVELIAALASIPVAVNERWPSGRRKSPNHHVERPAVETMLQAEASKTQRDPPAQRSESVCSSISDRKMDATGTACDKAGQALRSM